MNNPASAFGHTFIRIDSEESEKGGNLLAYAANFSAQTGGDPGLLYAMKGVFGGYNGYFTILPYYQLVSKYSDLESRDIWEYPLELTDDEVTLLVEHLWEIRQTPFPYYYFDENCSYQLLSLFDVARPSLALSEKFKLWVLPVDTLRETMNSPGLVDKGVLYPSVGSKLLERMKRYSNDELQIVQDIIDTKGTLNDERFVTMPKEEKIKILELAYDFVEFKILRKKNHDAAYDGYALTLLKERSRIGNGDTMEATAPVISKFPPEDGHATKKISYGIGVQKRDLYNELSFRPAYHSLDDPIKGFDLGSAITMGEFTLGEKLTDSSDNDRTSGRLGIERFNLLQIQSLTPSQGLYSPLSWALNARFENIYVDGTRKELTEFQVGFGKTFSLGSNAAVYLLLTPHTVFGADLERGYGIAPTIEAGSFINWTEHVSTVLSTQSGYSVVGETTPLFRTNLNTNFYVSRSDALSLSAQYNEYFGERKPQMLVAYTKYF